MTRQEIRELAAILVQEHGYAALRVAEERRNAFAHEPDSDAYRLWSDILAEVGDLLGRTETVSGSSRRAAD